MALLSCALGAVRTRLGPIGNVHAREASRFDHAVARLRRPLDRRYLARFGRLDELRGLSEGVAARRPAAAAGSRRVLVVALRAFPNHTPYELTIAHALTLRGAEVALLTCGGGQPACEMGWARRVWPRPCDRCAHFTDALAGLSGLHVYRLRELLPWGGDGRRAPATADEIGGDLDPAAAAAISVPWFLHTSDADSVPEGPAARADFEVAAAGVGKAAERVLDEFRPDVVFMVNGLFAAERSIRVRALARGIRAPTYEMTPRQNTLFLSQRAPAAHYDVDHLWARVRDRELNPAQRAAVERLLAERESGVGAYERFFEQQEERVAALREKLDIPAGSRVVSLFTNLTWDSATLERDVGFASMIDWMAEAIRAAATLDDTVLVIRVHPADAKWGSREDIQAKAVAAAGGVPAQVRFIGPREPLSSYALLRMSDQVLTYASTTGLEAALMGIPVAVAGLVHYRGRGFTWDLEASADLRAFMTGDGVAMGDERVELARRYAFTFFFRAAIPFPAVHLEGGRPLSVPRSAAAIEPGADPYVDLICRGLLDGEEFAVPDDLALRAPDGAARPA